MKTIIIGVAMIFSPVGFFGCANLGSSFVELSVAYPNDELMQAEGRILVDELASLCSSMGLALRGSIERNPPSGGAYATFRTKGNEEPIIWVTIYRLRDSEITASVGSLKRYESSKKVLSLLNSVDARMKAVADRQRRLLKKSKHGSSILH